MSRTVRVTDLNTLASIVAEHQPRALYYIATGGRELGTALAQRLSVPAIPLEISYPLSGPLRRLPRWVAASLWPVKEITYKFTAPRSRCEFSRLETNGPIVLVDDSASSGKTLSLALDELNKHEITGDRVIRVVGRCGRRARELVDYCLNDLGNSIKEERSK